MNDYSNKSVDVNNTSETMAEDGVNKTQREDAIKNLANSSLITSEKESRTIRLPPMFFSKHQYTINEMPNEIFATFISHSNPFSRLAMSMVCKKWHAVLIHNDAWSDETCDFLKAGPEFMSKRMRFVKEAAIDFQGHIGFIYDTRFKIHREDWKKEQREDWKHPHKFKFINYSEMVVALCKKNGGFFRFCNDDQRKDLSLIYELILKTPKAQYGNLLMCASNEMKRDIRLQYIVNFCCDEHLPMEISSFDIKNEKEVLNNQQKNKIINEACKDIASGLQLK